MYTFHRIPEWAFVTLLLVCRHPTLYIQHTSHNTQTARQTFLHKIKPGCPVTKKQTSISGKSNPIFGNHDSYHHCRCHHHCHHNYHHHHHYYPAYSILQKPVLVQKLIGVISFDSTVSSAFANMVKYTSRPMNTYVLKNKIKVDGFFKVYFWISKQGFACWPLPIDLNRYLQQISHL